MQLIFGLLIFLSLLHSDSIDNLMEGFNSEPSIKIEKKSQDLEIRGTITQEILESPTSSKPHNGFSSLETSLFLDYEHKFTNGFKFKSNIKGYYNFIYNIRGRDNYSRDEIEQLESELEPFEIYIDGSVSEDLDIKIGRQIVVWGRSDTIRVTDILNPIDNRRPAMVDIDDLRLPITMAKLDYFIGDWRVTPIAILEQRFSKNPPFGAGFNPSPKELPKDKRYGDITPALSIGGEFENWDINFYASQTRSDSGYLQNNKISHNRIDMVGTACNILNGSWLIKSEVAYLNGLKFTSTADKTFKRIDMLAGFEYNGIADSMLSYDIVLRDINNYDDRLSSELIPIKKRLYQHAFRATSEFFNATLTGNYLVSLYGLGLNSGGFQRLWFDYDISDEVKATLGFVDYIGGSKLSDTLKENDILFGTISYSF